MDLNREESEGNGDKGTGNQMFQRIENKLEIKPDENVSQEGNDAGSFGDFEMVSAEGIPNADSEEISRIYNTSYTPQVLGMIFECLQQTPSSYLPDVSVVSNIGLSNYVGSIFQGLTTDTNAEDSGTITRLEDELTENIKQKLEEVKTFEDEICWRDCLGQAMVDNCEEVIKQNVTGDANAMALLSRKGCINNEEKLYLKGKSDDPAQCMRGFFSMIINRDLKTLFTFVCILKLLNSELFEKIVSDFHKHLQKMSVVPMKCSRCVLVEKVNIRTVVNYFAKWTKFFQKVSEAKLHESDSLWEEFFEIINSPSMYEEAVASLIKAIEACGFHSDILSMLCADVESKIHIFKCRCLEIGNNPEAYCVHYGKTKYPIQKPKLLTDGQHNANDPIRTARFVGPNCEESEAKVCLEPAIGTACYQNSPENIEMKDFKVQSQPSSLKRKNSLMEDGQNVERSKRKASDNSAVNSCPKYCNRSNGDIKPQPYDDTSVCKDTSTEKKDANKGYLKMDTLKAERTEYECETDSVLSEHSFAPISLTNGTHIDMNNENIKGDSSDENHRLDDLKLGVPGYDSKEDSGFSETQPLSKNSVINVDDENDETVPKQIVSGLILSPSHTSSSKTHDAQELEKSQIANSLESIDADCQEWDDSRVNNVALNEALEEASVESLGINEQDRELHEADSECQPFINIVPKRK